MLSQFEHLSSVNIDKIDRNVLNVRIIAFIQTIYFIIVNTNNLVGVLYMHKCILSFFFLISMAWRCFGSLARRK